MPKPDQVAKHIHVGIGGLDFAPWRGVFYPTACRTEGARLRGEPPHVDRDQRHILPHADTGDLSQVESECPR